MTDGPSVNFGCDYCRDDQNRFFGHVIQVATSDERRTILIQCPRCDALYENTPRGRDETRRLTAEEAARLFPSWRSPHSATPNQPAPARLSTAGLAEGDAPGASSARLEMKTDTRNLCQLVLASRAPALLPLLDRPALTRADVDAINNVLTEELATSGFDSRYEPTDYGRQLEDAIDEFNRLGAGQGD